MEEVFEPRDQEWRGLGVIPASGLALRPEYADMDAERAFADLLPPPLPDPRGCRCGEVLRGVATPPQCPLFGGVCTPSYPMGACMVSAEGACAAYYRYGRGGAAARRAEVGQVAQR